MQSPTYLTLRGFEISTQHVVKVAAKNVQCAHCFTRLSSKHATVDVGSITV